MEKNKNININMNAECNTLNAKFAHQERLKYQQNQEVNETLYRRRLFSHRKVV